MRRKEQGTADMKTCFGYLINKIEYLMLLRMKNYLIL